MPYQPTNPYPYNTAIDLKDGLQFRFKVDNYDTIESFKIELYDYLKNKKLYTIVRTMGDVEIISTFQLNQNNYMLKVNETQKIKNSQNEEVQGTVILYKDDVLMFPSEGTVGDIDTFKGTIEGYSIVLKNKIEKELDRMSEAMADKQVINGSSQLIQILDENEEQLLLKEYTDESFLPIKGGLGAKSIGEVDVTPYLASIEAIEMKKYYGNTTNYEVLNVTNEECFILDETGTIISYNEEKNTVDKANIVIPYRTSDGTVKNIGTGVFANKENIKTVVIPSCIITIGNEAFNNCVNLETVSLNYGVSKLNEACFANCSKLFQINLLDSIEVIENQAFKGCTSLVELRLSWSLTQINEYAFSDIGIKELELPPNLEYIEQYAFYSCSSLETILCNDKLKIIRECAFGDCKVLNTVKLNEHLVELEQKVFLNCKALQEIKIPKDIQTISPAILKGCDSLLKLIVPFIGAKQLTLEDEEIIKNVNPNFVLGYFFNETETGIDIEQYNDFVPKSLGAIEITNTSVIPYGAFYNCTELRQVTMLSSIVYIADYGFYNCIKISDIILSPNIQYIGNYAFALKEPKNLE